MKICARNLPQLLLCAISIALASTASATTFSISEVPVDPGAYLFANALNNNGQATGYSLASGSPHAFLSSRTPSDLGTFGGNLSAGFGINALGHVAGFSSTSQQTLHAFQFDGRLHDLGTLGGANSLAYDINDHGQVVGYSATAQMGHNHAFLYSGGVMSDLGTLGGSFSVANGINNSGSIAGASLLAGNAQQRAFRYADGRMNDLGTLGGTSSYGYDLNEAGAVVGYSTLANEADMHAFVYDTTMTDLGTLGGMVSIGLGINDSGQVVGQSQVLSGENHAFFYSGGVMRDLNDLIAAEDSLRTFVTLAEARDINNVGQIVANGIDSRTGQTRAYLLTPLASPVEAAAPPVPLPASGLLLLSGLGGLLGFRRLAATQEASGFEVRAPRPPATRPQS